MRYLVIGAGGMAGHMIANYLIEQGEYVEGVARSKQLFCNTHTLDVTNFEKLRQIVTKGNYDYIINCVGILNKEVDKHLPESILVNTYLPHFLADITLLTDTKIIHMSTDCVFSGQKGAYLEKDIPDGETYYDKTKALGEIIDTKNLTFRNSIIGPDINETGIGLFNWFMKQKGRINGFEKSIWNGVTTLTLAKAIYSCRQTNLTGIYHLSNNTKVSKYELLILLKKYSGHDVEIEKIEGIKQDKSLVNTRNDFDFTIKTYDEQISELFSWIETHKELYSHYY